MQFAQIGTSSLVSSRLAYGCWRVAGNDVAPPSPDLLAAGKRAFSAAYDAGFTLFDHADIYGYGRAETLFGDWLRENPGLREKILIATKCGVRRRDDPAPGTPARWDFSAGYIVTACEASLRRLRVDAIDLFMLHRPDYLANPEEIARALSALQGSGKVRFFGVSNFRPSLVAALSAAGSPPLAAHQVEISLAKLDAFNDGTLDQCLENKMTPMAWSPLAGGLLGEGASRLLSWQKQYKTEAINAELDVIAKERGASRTALALAWLLKHPSRIIPVVGSTSPERIREAAKAAELELSREEWYRLLAASMGPLP